MNLDVSVSSASPAIHTLRDGRRILVRPVVASDREHVERGYAALSPATRRARFGVAPDHLSPRRLDQLVDLDYHDRYAVVAVAIDDPGEPGIGVARYLREPDDPTIAEVAVIVLDEYQQRGIATVLVRAIVDAARVNGISTLTGTVMWDNTRLLEALRAAGALLAPTEPGVAIVRYRLVD